jgi:tRNA pseudouridine55 synthase
MPASIDHQRGCVEGWKVVVPTISDLSTEQDMKTTDSRIDGLLIVDKPAGITSRKVVDRVEHWFPGVRIGHAGTLDPLATGVLVLCLGQATRLIEYVQQLPKAYDARIRLGAWSSTDDAEGHLEQVPDPPVPTEDRVREGLSRFVGWFEQIPPAHSAAHVQGQRAYRLARRGKPVALTPRRVWIERLHLHRYRFPDLELTIECGKGTYIRSLARDLGQVLGCGGYLTALRRTRIGPFRITEALDLALDASEARMHILPVRTGVAHLPALHFPAQELHRFRQGQSIPWPGRIAGGPDVAIFDETQELVGMASWDEAGQRLLPRKIL